MAKEKEHTASITKRFLLLMDEVMHNHGLNKTQFAKSIGEHAQNISVMEKGGRSPTLDQVARACEVYRYDANWLLLGKGQKLIDKKLDAPIEKRVTDLEVQLRNLKALVHGITAKTVVNNRVNNSQNKVVK